MKKILDVFRVPKEGKLPEKTLLARVGLSVGVVVLCMVMLSVSAYAYFTASLTSGVNSIRSAKFDLAVTVTSGEQTLSPSGYVYALPAGTYTVTLEKTEDSTASVGFGTLIFAKDSADAVKSNTAVNQKYYTKPIGTQVVNEGEGSVEIETAAVTVTVSEGKTVYLAVIPQWGSPANPQDSTLNTGVWTFDIPAETLDGLFPVRAEEIPVTSESSEPSQPESDSDPQTGPSPSTEDAQTPSDEPSSSGNSSTDVSSLPASTDVSSETETPSDTDVPSDTGTEAVS